MDRTNIPPDGSYFFPQKKIAKEERNFHTKKRRQFDMGVQSVIVVIFNHVIPLSFYNSFYNDELLSSEANNGRCVRIDNDDDPGYLLNNPTQLFLLVFFLPNISC